MIVKHHKQRKRQWVRTPGDLMPELNGWNGPWDKRFLIVAASGWNTPGEILIELELWLDPATGQPLPGISFPPVWCVRYGCQGHYFSRMEYAVEYVRWRWPKLRFKFLPESRIRGGHYVFMPEDRQYMIYGFDWCGTRYPDTAGRLMQP